MLINDLWSPAIPCYNHSSDFREIIHTEDRPYPARPRQDLILGIDLELLEGGIYRIGGGQTFSVSYGPHMWPLCGLQARGTMLTSGDLQGQCTVKSSQAPWPIKSLFLHHSISLLPCHYPDFGIEDFLGLWI